MTWTFLVPLLFVYVAETTASVEDEFTRVCALRPQVVGRDEIVRGFERIIDAHPDEEIAARCMIRIGALYLLQDATCEMVADSQTAHAWFQKAAAAASLGSPAWIDATNRVGRYLRDRSAAQGEHLMQSRRLFESVRQYVTPKTPAAIRLDFELFQQDVREQLLNEAQDRAVSIKAQIAGLPADSLGQNEKRQLELLNEVAATLLISEWQRSTAPDRAAAIQRIRAEYGGIENVRERADHALTSIPSPLTKPEFSWRVVVIMINGAALAALAVSIATRRNSGGGAASPTDSS